MGLRRKSRELVVQTFYALSYAEVDQYLQHLDYLSKYQEILDDLIAENDITKEDNVYEFADNMIKNMIPKLDDIDDIIKNNLGENKIEKLGTLELIIMRMATFEMCFEKTAPAVIINEAVDLTKKYCAEKSPALVNAILDKVKGK